MMSTDKKRIPFIFLVGVLSLLSIVTIVTFFCMPKHYLKTESGSVWVGDVLLDNAVATFYRDSVTVPVLPILKEYGYTITCEADGHTIITKNDCVYQLDLDDLTLYLMEDPQYNDMEIPQVNLLAPTAGTKKGDWIIMREDNDIIVDCITMVGILELLHEKPMIRVSYVDYTVCFSQRDEINDDSE